MTIDALAAQIRENARNRRNGQFGHHLHDIDPTVALAAGTQHLFGEPGEQVAEPESSSADRLCDECGEVIDESDEHCMDCKCTCGNTLNDGNGWDGKCGTCADAAEADDEDEDDEVDLVCSIELIDEEGDTVDFSIIRLEESRYEVESTGDPIAEFDYVGDEEAHDAIQEAAMEALKLAGHKLTELDATVPDVEPEW